MASHELRLFSGDKRGPAKFALFVAFRLEFTVLRFTKYWGKDLREHDLWNSRRTDFAETRCLWNKKRGEGGATVAERSARSPPTVIRVQSPAGSLRIFACANRAGRCRCSAGFLGGLPFPPPLHSGAAPYSPQSPSSARKTSDVKSRPNLFTSLHVCHTSIYDFLDRLCCNGVTLALGKTDCHLDYGSKRNPICWSILSRRLLEKSNSLASRSRQRVVRFERLVRERPIAGGKMRRHVSRRHMSGRCLMSRRSRPLIPWSARGANTLSQSLASWVLLRRCEAGFRANATAKACPHRNTLLQLTALRQSALIECQRSLPFCLTYVWLIARTNTYYRLSVTCRLSGLTLAGLARGGQRSYMITEIKAMESFEWRASGKPRSAYVTQSIPPRAPDACSIAFLCFLEEYSGVLTSILSA
ncbi:hypothetical protein PR048_022873 [Dryococelus australis]|uniref:Uncharacterized protein n=1 Tax=Dryococelus australis TaxID=614101 RepID=A0ABQ9GSK0_9NEOP|nr:hypothetical protein PR048_022873 [Dryococelus australis]